MPSASPRSPRKNPPTANLLGYRQVTKLLYGLTRSSMPAASRQWKALDVPRCTKSGQQWPPHLRRRIFDAAVAVGSKQRSQVSCSSMRSSRRALGSRASSVRKWWQGAVFSTRTYAARLPQSPDTCRWPFPPASPSRSYRTCGQSHRMFYGCSRGPRILFASHWSPKTAGEAPGISAYGHSMLRDQAFMCVCGVCVPHPPHLCHPWHGETLP